MARLRCIKPEFWSDVRLCECSHTARLLFIAALNFADDYGNLDRSARQLKGQAFPHDDGLDCEPLIRELIRIGSMIEYKVQDVLYLHIKNFQKHQKIQHKSEARFPAYDDSLRIVVQVCEGNGRAHIPLTLDRVDRVDRVDMRGQNPSAHRSAAPRDPPPEFLDFKLAYPSRAGDQGWRKALRAAHARLAEGYSWPQMVEGARRYAAYVCSTGNQGTEYVKQAATFLGPDLPFLEPWNPPATKAENQVASNLSASVEWLHAKR